MITTACTLICITLTDASKTTNICKDLSVLLLKSHIYFNKNVSPFQRNITNKQPLLMGPAILTLFKINFTPLQKDEECHVW